MPACHVLVSLMLTQHSSALGSLMTFQRGLRLQIMLTGLMLHCRLSLAACNRSEQKVYFFPWWLTSSISFSHVYIMIRTIWTWDMHAVGFDCTEKCFSVRLLFSTSTMTWFRGHGIREQVEVRPLAQGGLRVGCGQWGFDPGPLGWESNTLYSIQN